MDSGALEVKPTAVRVRCDVDLCVGVKAWGWIFSDVGVQAGITCLGLSGLDMMLT